MTSSAKREYVRKTNGSGEIATVFRDAEGKLSFVSQGSCETVATQFEPDEEERQFAQALFQQDRFDTLQTFDPSHQDVFERDAFVLLQLRPAEIQLLSELSLCKNRLDLALPSSVEELNVIIHLAASYTRACLAARAIEARIRTVLSHRVHETLPSDAEPPYFFDNWSEGPFSVDDVARWVAEKPERAEEFHSVEGKTFAEYARVESVPLHRTTVYMDTSHSSPETHANHHFKHSRWRTAIAAILGVIFRI